MIRRFCRNKLEVTCFSAETIALHRMAGTLATMLTVLAVVEVGATTSSSAQQEPASVTPTAVMPGPVVSGPATAPQPTTFQPSSSNAYFPSDNSPNTLEMLSSLKEKGAELAYPGFGTDSLLQNDGNVRSSLANLGIGVNPYTSDIFAYNVFNNASPRRPRDYLGQGPTIGLGSQAVLITYDMSHLGVPGGQIIFQPQAQLNSYTPNGPNEVTIGQLQYYQSLLNRTIEMKVGWGANLEEFTGVFGIGGNPTVNTGGITAAIPIEVGLSYLEQDAPTINLTLNGADDTYLKTGIQRSISPLGNTFGARSNGIGLRFGSPGAGVLYIEEAGIRREATAVKNQLWLRFGGMYNTTDYTQFRGGNANNWALYGLVDYQLLKTDTNHPFKGIYAGVSAEYAPPNINAYSQHFEGRVYSIGLFATRPTDIDSLVLSYDNFSRQGRAVLASDGLQTAPSTFAVGLSHTIHVMHGLYIAPGVTYVDHPAFLGDYKSAFNISLEITAAL